MKKEYSAPALTEYGSVQAITGETTVMTWKFDKNFPAHTLITDLTFYS